MAATFSPEIMAKIKEVTAMDYKSQAIFYLNAFWPEGADAEAETVWELVAAFVKEDHIKGKAGNELNPIQAFHVLQARNQTLTALELKAQLRKVDIDANGEMALAEYLLFINNRDPIKFITNPQGEIDPVKLKALEDKLAELNTKFEQLQVQLDAEKKAEAAAKAAEGEAIKKEADAKAAEQLALDEEAKAKAAEQKALDEEAKSKVAEQAAQDAAVQAAKAEAELKKVEEEARVIAAEIKAQEDAKAAEIARLEKLSTDQSVGIVKRNMAVQELAQAKGEDPLPLRKAKLTQEAVVRRLEKATKAAAEETQKAKNAAVAATEAKNAAIEAAKQAVAARQLAEQKRAAAVQAREAAEAQRAAAVEARKQAEAAAAATARAIEETKELLAEVEAELVELRSKSGVPQGLIWYTNRELEDKKRSLPTRMW